MFSEEDVKSFLATEFQSYDWGQEVSREELIDPLVDSYGPRLADELDPQELQKFLMLSDPELKSSFVTREEVNLPIVIVPPTKTRLQITLKSRGRNVPGHSSNFVVHNIGSSELYDVLSSLKDKYPKIKSPDQTVRLQFTEYENGEYRSDRVANLNLHNADVEDVSRFVSRRLVLNGFFINNRAWYKKNKTNGTFILPASVVNVSYNKSLHHGKWCLCRVKNGSSWVLSVKDDLSSAVQEQENIGSFTYILDPSGLVYRRKDDARTNY